MKPVIIIAIAFVLLIPLPVFAPSHPEYVGSETMDFENCNGFLSIEDVKSVIGDIDDLAAYSSAFMPVDGEPGLKTTCRTTFESSEKTIGMTLVVMDSTDAAIALYQKNYDSISGQDFEIREYLTFWNNFDVVLNDQGLGSLVGSQYDKFFINFHTSFDGDGPALADVEQLRMLSTMVQKKILDLDDVPISPPNPVLDNDVGPTTDEPPISPPSLPPIEEGVMILPPKKQLSQGIEPENIQCRESLVLFLRDSGQPICIKPTTMQKLVERQQIDESNSQIIIKTGTYAGLCLGYCIQDFVITSEKILYSQTGLELVSESREELPAKIKQIPISELKWQELTDLIDLQKFNSLSERIGCPGCADGLVEWIEISDGKKTKKIEFEPKDSIPEIDELVIMLREIRNTAASSITTFEECIAAGNPAMESYPRQCRTVNGEHFVEEIDEDVRAPTPEITGKRSPVDVPDATNENDMLCQTHWNVETTEELNTEHIKESVQSTIAQFGMTYLLEEREITVSESSLGYVVSISGLWEPESVQYLMITEDLEKISGVKIQGEPAMCI